jgi:DNA polymerase I-like protein with 3'-5' exonuclease and polymerase domains
VEEKRTGSDLDAFIKYGAKDAYYTRRLKFIFAKMLRDDTAIQRVFHKIMMPCVRMFVEAEYHGVFIDVARMDDAEVYLQEKIDEAEETLNQYSSKLVFHKATKKFVSIKGVLADEIGPKRQPYARLNWGSSAQLGIFLYDHLGLPIIEKTKGGAPSTSESVMLRTEHPIAKALLKYRGAQKQLVSFIDGWRKYLVGDRLHPSFKLHGTVTGRLSCVNPNLQQVPRDPRIRTLITAPPGWTLLEADLSQIEMRIAAELSGDRALLEAYRVGIDVHWLTALREIGRSGALKDEIQKTVKHITGEEMDYGDAINEMLRQGPSICEEAGKVLGINWKEHRKKAKAINFGYLYGMWWKKFREYARDNYGVEITDDQAMDSRLAYFELYGDLPDWHRRQKRKAKIDGYVRSLSGRKRRLPAAMANDGSFDAQAAERQAINSPVQSFANDINLMAALQLTEEFGPEVVNLVGTVHDAVLVEVRNDMVPEVYNRLLVIMQRPDLFDDFNIQMAVPIEADAELGPWGIGTSLTRWQELQEADTGRRKRRTREKPAIRKRKTRKRKVA